MKNLDNKNIMTKGKVTKEFDKKGNLLSVKHENGHWIINRYDEKGNIIFHQTSNAGIIFNKG